MGLGFSGQVDAGPGLVGALDGYVALIKAGEKVIYAFGKRIFGEALAQ